MPTLLPILSGHFDEIDSVTVRFENFLSISSLWSGLFLVVALYLSLLRVCLFFFVLTIYIIYLVI